MDYELCEGGGPMYAKNSDFPGGPTGNAGTVDSIFRHTDTVTIVMDGTRMLVNSMMDNVFPLTFSGLSARGNDDE